LHCSCGSFQGAEERGGTRVLTIGFPFFDVVNIFHPQLDIVSRHETTFNNIFQNEYFLSNFEKLHLKTIAVDRKLIGAKGKCRHLYLGVIFW
jgi:hypothetical protein